MVFELLKNCANFSHRWREEAVIVLSCGWIVIRKEKTSVLK